MRWGVEGLIGDSIRDDDDDDATFVMSGVGSRADARCDFVKRIARMAIVNARRWSRWTMRISVGAIVAGRTRRKKQGTQEMNADGDLGRCRESGGGWGIKIGEPVAETTVISLPHWAGGWGTGGRRETR